MQRAWACSREGCNDSIRDQYLENRLNLSIKGLLILIAGWAGLGLSNAMAQSAGSWLGRAGVSNINPKVESGELSAPSLAGTKADVKGSTRVGGGLTYMLTDNFAIDVPLALPSKHEIVGAGAISRLGKLGDIKMLPMSVLGQYRFMDAGSAFRPYVGAGLSYIKFFDAKSTLGLTTLAGGASSTPVTFTLDNQFAFTMQVGLSYAINSRWGVDFTASKTLLKTVSTLSTGQTMDLALNPVSMGLALTYKF